MSKCFYCGVHIGSGARYTADHVYPRALLKCLTNEQRGKLSPLFGRLNKVHCCHGCNSYKGRLHPLDWLVIMPDAHQAKKLAEHLTRMGEDMQEVFDAMKRRRNK